MTLDEAIDEINDKLCLDAGITLQGDELKIWTYDSSTGGRSKDYINTPSIIRLIDALTVIKDNLTARVNRMHSKQTRTVEQYTQRLK